MTGPVGNVVSPESEPLCETRRPLGESERRDCPTAVSCPPAGRRLAEHGRFKLRLASTPSITQGVRRGQAEASEPSRACRPLRRRQRGRNVDGRAILAAGSAGDPRYRRGSIRAPSEGDPPPR
jgi:hypothetical protein